jgi:DNA-binding response OmpR family regulator
LYIVRRFTEMHGGVVRLRSKPDAGSVFTLAFPQHNGALREADLPADAKLEQAYAGPGKDWIGDSVFQETLPSVAESTPVSGDERVLLVEDNPDLLEFLRATFRSQYQILTARDGREGLDLARRFRPDVIITDIMMPHVSGLDLLREIRADAELAETPVILLTARAMIKDRVRGLAQMADDYVGKPFYVRELLLRVRNLLYRKRLRELAVARENQRIYADFHDHLGARLTDLSMLAGRLEARDSDHSELATRNELRRNLSVLVEDFRNCLSARDDLMRLRENFANGLHMILLRRYINAGRQLRFAADSKAREILAGRIDEAARSALHAACTELATNDIRYGTDVSRWDLSASAETLAVTLRSTSNYESSHAPGHGIANVRERLVAIGARFDDALADGQYSATIRLRGAGNAPQQ